MNTLYSIVDKGFSLGFSLWFNEEETAAIDSHVKEKFDYIEYGPKRYSGMHNKYTNEVMFNESSGVVRFKCFMILIGNPIHMLGRVPFQLIKGVYLAHCAVWRLDAGGIGKEIEKILMVPFCGVGIQFAAFIGLFYDPYRGRERIGLLEKKLNDGLSYDAETNGAFLARCCQPWFMYVNDDSPYKITRREPFVKPSDATWCACLA